MATIKQRVAVALLGASVGLVSSLALHEGKSNVAYVDKLATSKVVTICYGDTGGHKIGDYRTDKQCSELLLRKLNSVYVPIVQKYVTVPLSQGEFDALVDFVYNLGEGNFRSSTLLRKLNAGDREGAAQEFARWYKTNGKDCRIRSNKCYGIIERRAWQKTTFES